jgi:hypothetical protein
MRSIYRKQLALTLASCATGCLTALALTYIEAATIAETAVQVPVSIGQKLGPITFTDIRFLRRSLNDFASKMDPVPKRAFVLIFTNVTCPMVQRYWPRLKQLDAEFRDQGVQFVAVNVGPDDSLLEMATQAVVHDVPFPFVKDTDGSCVAACGVRRTTEAVVIDADNTLRYRGRIDSRYRLSGTAPGDATSELRDAIQSILGGKPIVVSEMPVEGCAITKPRAHESTEKFSYARQIKPILERHCTTCHRPGTAAPFSLTSYDEAAGNAAMIAEVVQQRRMPPWYASAEFGEFINDRTMPSADRRLLVNWAQSGASSETKSESIELNTTKTVATNVADPWGGISWQMGDPDLVLEAPFTYDVPPDGYVDYKYTLLPAVFLHDSYIQSVEVQPNNPRVVHHSNLGYMPIGTEGMYARLITGYVPGVGPMQLENGVASKIPAGSAVGLQIHLTTDGKPERVRLRVGFRYPRYKVQKELYYLQLSNRKFAIPPFAAHYPVSRTKSVSDDVTLFGFFAHMHVRGKDVTFRAFPPRGDPVTLLMVPNYNFDWQMPYHLPSGKVKLPAGTKFECLAHFDNSTFNPYNPDPSATVRDGQQTYQEMMYGYVFYTKDKEQLNLTIDTKTGQAN